LWYRDYRNNRHLDDSTIVRFGIAIYRDNLQHCAPLVQQITTGLLASSPQRRMPRINSPCCKTASHLHLLYLMPPPPMEPRRILLLLLLLLLGEHLYSALSLNKILNALHVLCQYVANRKYLSAYTLSF